MCVCVAVGCAPCSCRPAIGAACYNAMLDMVQSPDQSHQEICSLEFGSLHEVHEMLCAGMLTWASHKVLITPRSPLDVCRFQTQLDS